MLVLLTVFLTAPVKRLLVRGPRGCELTGRSVREEEMTALDRSGGGGTIEEEGKGLYN